MTKVRNFVRLNRLQALSKSPVGSLRIHPWQTLQLSVFRLTEVEHCISATRLLITHGRNRMILWWPLQSESLRSQYEKNYSLCMYYCLLTQLFIFSKGVLIRDSVYQLSKEKITIPTIKKTDAFFFQPIVMTRKKNDFWWIIKLVYLVKRLMVQTHEFIKTCRSFVEKS